MAILSIKNFRLIESLGIVSVERLIQVIPKTLSVCFQKWIDNRQSQGINFVLLCVLEIVLDSTGFDFDSISILFGCYLDAIWMRPEPAQCRFDPRLLNSKIQYSSLVSVFK